MRMTMSRPCLVTSSGPSPVLGFMAAIHRPLSTDRGHPKRTSSGRPPGCAHQYPVSGRAREIVRAAGGRTGVRRPSSPPATMAHNGGPAADGEDRGSSRGGSVADVPTQSSEAPVRCTREGAVATVRLDRPGAMNSLTLATKTALLEVLRRVAADDAVRCVVLTG